MTSKMLNVVCLAEVVAQVHQYFDTCMPVNVPVEKDKPIAKFVEKWTNKIAVIKQNPKLRKNWLRLVFEFKHLCSSFIFLQ